jgi:hypothetical protein
MPEADSNGDLGKAAPGWGRTLRRLSWESAIPLVLAGIYAAWDVHSTKGSFVLGPFVKVFAPAFFLLMWFVGQFLRVKKQLHDRDLLTGINADVKAIRDALRKKAVEQGENPPATPEATLIADPVAAEMVQQAKAAFDANLNLPALLMAAAAFEHAIRASAKRLNIEEGPRVPIRRTISELERVLPRGVSGELQALWMARNRIVHSRDLQINWSSDAQQLFNGFRWAIALVSNLRNAGDEEK